MKCTEFKELQRNSLLGFATLQMDSGLIMKDCALHESHGQKWVSPPSKPQIGKDGAVMKDAKGKAQYSPIIDFASKHVRDKWSAAAVAAIDHYVADNNG